MAIEGYILDSKNTESKYINPALYLLYGEQILKLTLHVGKCLSW